MGLFPAFPGFPNFYSSETGDINTLHAQKLGNLFFPFAQLLFPPRDKDRNPLISRFRIFRKTLSSSRPQTFVAAPPLRASIAPSFPHHPPAFPNAAARLNRMSPPSFHRPRGDLNPRWTRLSSLPINRHPSHRTRAGTPR
jgi:hypothetical protein